MEIYTVNVAIMDMHNIEQKCVKLCTFSIMHNTSFKPFCWGDKLLGKVDSLSINITSEKKKKHLTQKGKPNRYKLNYVILITLHSLHY